MPKKFLDKPNRVRRKKLTVLEPLTFRVQEALLLQARQSNFPLSLLDPNGFEIDKTALNILDIGMTTKETPAQKRRMGFSNMREATPTDNDQVGIDEDRPVFEAEAILHINPESDTWVMEVKDACNLQKYAGVAAAVMKMFQVNITVTLISRKIEQSLPHVKTWGIFVLTGNPAQSERGGGWLQTRVCGDEC